MNVGEARMEPSAAGPGLSLGPSSLSLACDALLVAIFLVATVCNSLVLLVFYRKPGLRTLSNRFVVNLVVTNLASCWVLAPLALLGRCGDGPGDGAATAADERWRTATAAAATGFCAATVLSVLLIGVDQYFAVIDPLRYHTIVDNARSAGMIAAAWCFSAVCAALGALFYRPDGCGPPPPSPPPRVPAVAASAFAFAYPAVVFFLPFAVICMIYASIYSAARLNSQRTRRNGSACGFAAGRDSAAVAAAVAAEAGDGGPEYAAVPRAASEPAMARSPTKTSLRSTSSFIVNSLRSRISNASLFKYRHEEARAARISALVAVMGLVCWCPFALSVMAAAPALGAAPSPALAKLALTMLLLTGVVSPLLFAHRNRRVQRDLRKLFGLGRRPPGASRQSRPPPPTRAAFELRSGGSFLRSAAWWREGVRIAADRDKLAGASASLICITVPESALDVDNGRSSFSSGASSSTQRSTSAASVSSLAADDC